ncbi:hypothetical protein AVEN_190056-1 [Araneus ventricosus]|uniref:Uncharacterized protein n=1 Tax=Araneus ventricosus TaxID=182803 RepID=A0A4Y2MP14_ARAVE|nr:hypothetical protein AVEN_190056-1 [Araneus ventricosus]
MTVLALSRGGGLDVEARSPASVWDACLRLPRWSGMHVLRLPPCLGCSVLVSAKSGMAPCLLPSGMQRSCLPAVVQCSACVSAVVQRPVSPAVVWDAALCLPAGVQMQLPCLLPVVWMQRSCLPSVWGFKASCLRRSLGCSARVPVRRMLCLLPVWGCKRSCLPP